MDSGGYLAFCKGNSEMLLLSDNQCTVKSINKDVAIFQGIFHLAVTHPNIGKNLSFLKGAEYLQIQFTPMKKDYHITEGKAICTFNGNARIEFDIPEQTMANKLIFARDISKTLNEALK